jgi:hypothetical protein
VFWQPFWKWETSRKFWKCRITPLMVTYHYVKFYVSIIIHLEVININVRNFSFFGTWTCPRQISGTTGQNFMKLGGVIDICFVVKGVKAIFLGVQRGWGYNLTIMKSPKPATDTIYPHIKFWWYRTMLNFYRPFLCRVLAAILKMADILKILKMQNCFSNGDLSLCQILKLCGVIDICF